jgi:hypothetical protein
LTLPGAPPAGGRPRIVAIHPSRRAFVHHREELRGGEIGRSKIEDGLAVVAQVSRTKARFTE